MKTTQRLFGLMVVVALAPITAMASFTLTTQSSDTLGVNVFQQTTNNPCVIGDPSCKEPAGMNYTAVSGTPAPKGSTTYNLFSSIYKASSSVPPISGNLIPLTFQMGV